MREKLTEQKLVRAVKNAGGIAVKLVSPGFDGMPDRLVLLPGAKIAFVEVKAMGCKPRPLQRKRHEMLKALGFSVFVLDDEQLIPLMISEIMGGESRCQKSPLTYVTIVESHFADAIDMAIEISTFFAVENVLQYLEQKGCWCFVTGVAIIFIRKDLMSTAPVEISAVADVLRPINVGLEYLVVTLK